MNSLFHLLHQSIRHNRFLDAGDHVPYNDRPFVDLLLAQYECERYIHTFGNLKLGF